VKQQLAAVRMLFDWLITGQVVPTNPAAAVRGPKYVVTTGKTPVLDGNEWRKLLAAVPTDTVRDLRDRALIGTLTYSFARVGAALKLKVEDLRPNGTGWQIHLHEKGGKEHKMPCHHALSEMLHAYVAAAGIADDRKGWLFPHQSGAQRDGADGTADGSISGMVHGPPACSCGRHRRGDRQPHFPGDRHHELSGERRRARARPGSTAGGKKRSRRRRCREFDCDSDAARPSGALHAGSPEYTRPHHRQESPDFRSLGDTTTTHGRLMLSVLAVCRT
jgi:hypothetical protein